MIQEKLKAWGLVANSVHDGGNSPREIQRMGHDHWALEILMNASPRGITTIEMNGPRLHDQVFDLGHKHGLNMGRQYEPHGCDFLCHRGRHILRPFVTRKIAKGVQA